MTIVIITIVLLAIVGILIGIMLVFAGNKFKVEVDPREAEVREALPGNNCGACGYPGCDGCAAAIAKGEAPANACPVGGAPVAEKISAIMGVEAGSAADKKVAFVRCAGTCDLAKRTGNYVGIETCSGAQAVPGNGGKACQQGCLGFGECVAQCDFDAIHIVNGIAVVDREKCVGCGKCAKACPHRDHPRQVHVCGPVPQHREGRSGQADVRRRLPWLRTLHTSVPLRSHHRDKQHCTDRL